MKQNLIFIVALAAFVFGCNSKKNGLEGSNLKGKILQIQETSFEGEEKFGKYQVGEKNYMGHGIFVFNEEGNLKESQTLDREGKTKGVSKYSYDDNNNCTEILTYEDDELVQKQINTIKDDKVSEVKIYNQEGELTDIYQYEYLGVDISGGNILNKDGETIQTFKNEIANGLLNKQTVKDSLGEVTYIATYKRNAEGDVIEQITKYPKDTLEYGYSFKYEYDDKKNWTKQYQLDREGKIEDVIVRNIIYYDDAKEPKTENDFTGIWFVVDGNNWVEFRSDKKYDLGYDDRIKESGTWEIGTKQQVITFRADDPKDSKKYKFAFEGYQMVLFTTQGEEKVRLEKR